MLRCIVSNSVVYASIRHPSTEGCRIFTYRGKIPNINLEVSRMEKKPKISKVNLLGIADGYYDKMFKSVEKVLVFISLL